MANTLTFPIIVDGCPHNAYKGGGGSTSRGYCMAHEMLLHTTLSQKKE
jgi:hypothetical protein